jgi:hypothetical protein
MLNTLFIMVSQAEADFFIAFCVITFIIGLVQVFYFKGDFIRKLILFIFLLIPVFGIFIINGMLWHERRRVLVKG